MLNGTLRCHTLRNPVGGTGEITVLHCCEQAVVFLSNVLKHMSSVNMLMTQYLLEPMLVPLCAYVAFVVLREVFLELCAISTRIAKQVINPISKTACMLPRVTQLR